MKLRNCLDVATLFPSLSYFRRQLGRLEDDVFICTFWVNPGPNNFSSVTAIWQDKLPLEYF